MKFYIALISIVMWLSSCSEDLSGAFVSENFVNGYLAFNDISININVKEKKANLIFEGKLFDKTTPEYSDFAKRYNDTHYDQKLVPGENVCLKDTIVRIDIVTIGKYNDNYPDGSSINSIVNMSYSSPLEFINSGYAEIRSEGEVSLFRPRREFIPTTKNVNELTTTDLILLYSRVELEFLEAPITQNKLLKLIFVLSDGSTIAVQKEIRFS